MVILRGTVTSSQDNIITLQSTLAEPSQSLGSTMFQNMSVHKAQLAQIDAKTGQTDTYGALLQSCVRTALHMKAKNITRDHIIALCTTNHLNSVVPYIASQFLGARVAPIDPSLSPPEIEHLLKQVDPKIVFVVPESVPVVEEMVECEIVVFGETHRHTPFAEFLEPLDGEEEFQPVPIADLKDTAVIHFSSGTTGLPKGIRLSHYAFVGQSLNSLITENPDFEYMKAQAGRVSFPLTQLGYTSLYWVSAGVILLTTITQGYCRLVVPDFDGAQIWDFIQKYRPVVLILTPPQVMEMLQKRKTVDVGSVLSVMVIGSAISKEYNLQLQEAFPEADVSRCYGQTEACGILTTFRGNDLVQRPLMKHPDKIESIGLPIRGVSYKVVDLESGQNLGFHKAGELRIKSPFVMNGYHNCDSSDSFDEHGWLKTGDVAYYDQDYCFYIVDRIREAFKYKGWFITPMTLENVLLNHPAVKQAVVVGVPGEDGYHPTGVVVVDEGFGVGERDIERFVEERVPERQRLRGGVKFVKGLPLTVTGKVKRGEVRKGLDNCVE